MKVIFGGETKRIPEIKDYVELLKYAANIFDATHLQAKATDLKLFYQDDEGDIISVTCQSDLEEAYRIMTGRIKFVFSLDEEDARIQLTKGQQPTQPNDSFFQSECIRPNQMSILDRSSISQVNSDLGPCPMSARNMNNTMGLMFEAYLQNQLECAIRQRMTGISMLDSMAQANPSRLPIEGGPLEQPIPVHAIEDQMHVDRKVNDKSDQNIDQIVNELDEDPPESPSDAAAQHCLEEPNQNLEEVNTKDCEPIVASAVEACNSPKRSCGCMDESDFCFKCIFNKVNKVFSLEPFFEEQPSYQATCLDQPTEVTGVAGADFSATCRFKNTGKTAWPSNVQLRLVNGSTVVYNALGQEAQSVRPGEELNVTIELKFPIAPGNYVLQFTLVHGDNVAFGDEVPVNLVAKAPEPEPVPVSVSAEKPSEPISYRLACTLEEPLNETNGDTFYVCQCNNCEQCTDCNCAQCDNCEQCEDVRVEQNNQDGNDDEQDVSDGELDLSVNSWTLVDDAESAAEAPGGPEPMPEIDEDDPKLHKPTVLATLTEEEVRRNFYNKQVYMTRYDQKYRENLVALMKAGCLDFENNLQALRRNGNMYDPTVTEILSEIE